MVIKKIHFLGLSNALKPLYILEQLLNSDFLKDYEFAFIGNEEDGCVIDFCKKQKIKHYIYSELLKCDNYLADLLIVIGWSYFLKEDILSKYKVSINCHGGLLPDYRGNNTYMHSYANIADSYGATIHYINNSYDDGNIIIRYPLKLFLEETPLILHRRICEITALMIPLAINCIEKDNLGKQQQGYARYFYKISREEMLDIRKANEDNLKNNRPLIECKNKKWKI